MGHVRGTHNKQYDRERRKPHKDLIFAGSRDFCKPANDYTKVTVTGTFTRFFSNEWATGTGGGALREVAVTGNFMILQTNCQVATATGSGTFKESAYTHI